MTYTKPQSLSPGSAIFRSRACAQSVLFPSDADLPIQSPLARPRVMLSLRVIAYYGLIRDGGIHSPAYLLRLASLCHPISGGRIPSCPQFTLRVFPFVPSPNTPALHSGAGDYYFPGGGGLRHFRTGSAVAGRDITVLVPVA